MKFFGMKETVCCISYVAKCCLINFSIHMEQQHQRYTHYKHTIGCLE